MKAKICDRCGNFFNLQQQETNEFKLKRINKTASRYEKSLDLCPKCQEELRQWFDERNPKR
jgi:hypothetical protein